MALKVELPTSIVELELYKTSCALRTLTTREPETGQLSYKMVRLLRLRSPAPRASDGGARLRRTSRRASRRPRSAAATITGLCVPEFLSVCSEFRAK